MKRVGLVKDACFERHDTGPGHPETPERLRRCIAGLEAAGIVERCHPVPLQPAADESLLRVHEADYIRRVERACSAGMRYLDSSDTAICPESERLARLASGSLSDLGRRVARGDLDRGFAAVRPPGHHAERHLAMGFCLYNHVAVAAREIMATEDVTRVLIVDWDVHHGNGTQHIFEDDPNVFYFSLHQWPLYPGSGAREETGSGAGRGATLNCPLDPGAGDEEFLGALSGDLRPAMDRFRPEFVFVSAGFDAHHEDPLGGLRVSTRAYAAATRLVCEIADRWSSGRLVSVLEGGYDMQALSDSVVTHVSALFEP